MAPPTPLSIATSSLQRLVKEEASYHRELLQQEQSIRRLELDQSEEAEEEQGNRDFQLRQEVRNPGAFVTLLRLCTASN